MKINMVLTANAKQAEAQYAALTAQVAALNAQLERASATPSGFAQQARTMRAGQTAYAQALASTKAFNVEQLKLNDAINRQTDLLQKQKLSFREVWGREGRQNMKAVYRQQLAMQNMVARTITGGVTDGSLRTTLAVPTEVHKSWDTLSRRVGMFRHELASASQQLVNWGKNTQWAGRQLMVGFTMPIAAFGAAAGVMAYQVDKQLTRIAKVYDTTADANSKRAEDQIAVEKELANLREAGMKTGVEAAHQYGAAITDTLEVQAELAATGQQGAALQENTNQIMRIATLGEIDHATATQALIALQSTLGMTTKETANAFNYMNSVENATSLSTADFAKAIPIALGPMKEMGGNLQDLSVLLVAMKERGVDAAEGANAIKAMMQRLYRPSKQVCEEWMKLAKVDPLAIVEQTGGDVMQMLPRISEAVRDLDRPARVKLLAGLFGTYQVNRISKMLAGIDDMNNGIGQTSRVLEVNQQSWEDWADTADRELKKQSESASGQFKRALEGLKAELAVIGEPFLEVATAFLKLFAGAAKFFNALPDFVKKGAILFAMFAAAVGPIVMLTGLFANFAGNMLKFGAAMLKPLGVLELMTKTQLGNKIASEMAAKGYIEQATAAEVLERQLIGVNEALLFQAQAMGKLSGQPVPPGLLPYVNAYAPGTGPGAHLPDRPGPGQYTPLPMPIYEAPKVEPRRMTSQVIGGVLTPGESAEDYRKRQAAAEATAKANHEAAVANTIAANKANAESAIKEKTKGSVHGAAVATAAMAASMTAMMVTDNKMINQFANIALIASVAVPAVKGLGPLMGGVAEAASKAAKGTMALNAGAVGAAGGFRAAAAASKGLLAGMLAVMGPIGWTVTAITAIGVGLWYANKRQQEIYKQAVENQKALSNSGKAWAQELGRVEGHYRNITTLQGKAKEQSQIDRFLTEYESGSQKKTSDAFGELTDTEQLARARKMLLDMRIEGKMSIAETRASMTALFISVGQSAAQADSTVNGLMEELGDMKNVNWGAELANQVNIFKDQLVARGGMDDVVKQNAEDMGEIFAQGFLRKGIKPSEARAMFGQFAQAAQSEWQSLLERLQNISSGQDLLSKFDIKSAEDLAYWFRNTEDAMTEMRRVGFADQADEWRDMMQSADGTERAVVEAVAKTMRLGDEVHTVAELQKQATIWAREMSYEDALAQAVQMVNVVRAMRTEATASDLLVGMDDEALQNQKDFATEQARVAVNAINMAKGYKEGGTLTDALANLWGKVKNKTDQAKGAVDKVKGAVDRVNKNVDISFNIKGSWGDVLQQGMEGVQGDMADRASDLFDRRMNASLDAAQAGWDKRIAGQQAAQERQMDGLDKKWERRKAAVENYYDARIKAVDKAIKAEQKAEAIRQRIFEAEQQRLERAAEVANRTIDFRVALMTGDLDEAAKIRNDMDAQVSEWALGDAAAASGSRSQRRIDKLEGKKDRISEQREKELKAIEEREKAERAHLERVQKMRSDALKAQSEAAMDANRRMWENDRDTLDNRLELFKSYTGRNQADLERWMKKVGLTYDDFGIKVKGKGENWSRYFENSLTRHVTQAATSIANSNMWEKMGDKQAKKLLAGMGFSSVAGFSTFVKTGKLPGSFGRGARNRQSGFDAKRSQQTADIYNHAGGVVGANNSNRTGVARNIRGLHPNEQRIVAQKGEFLVNRDSASKHENLLNAINSDRIGQNTSRTNKGHGVGGNPGAAMAGLASYVTGRAFTSGVGMAMNKVVNEKIAAMRSVSGSYAAGKAGMYSDRAFSLEQLKNAATIANVGSKMGMSARDIMIGIMTAITESGLINVNYGDRDSLGLFQQRPSMGWGTRAQVTNPSYAAKKFFSVLKGYKNRGDMTPWMAAQSVQRSAFSDGSNYRQYWDNAQAIYKRGLARNTGPGPGGGAKFYPAGEGGWHRASVPGKGWSNSHDYRNGYKSPLYAVADGTIIESRGIRSGGSPEHPNAYPRGYRSYGVTVALRTKGGDVVRYAHMWPGTNIGLGPIKGGTKVGLSAATGNASGPHTHFDINGNYNAREWFAAHGIGLKTGGYIQSAGMANLHKQEVVVDKIRTQKLFDGIDNFALNSGARYNLEVNITEPGASADEIANKVMNKLKQAERRKPTRRVSSGLDR